jgi:uncharacterized membrane protein YeaQ/YmgE (transglycosylase-associated protein family)
VINVNILVTLVFGALVGWLASIVAKTNSQQGLLGDVVLGIIGSLVGGMLFNLFGEPGVSGFNLYSIIVGVIGALVFLVIGRAFMRLFS